MLIDLFGSLELLVVFPETVQGFKRLKLLVNVTCYFSPSISPYPKVFHLQERLKKKRLIQTTDQILVGFWGWGRRRTERLLKCKK